MDYGVANQGPDRLNVDSIAILDEAKNLGIKIVDTAPAYGTAEKTIGQYHAKNAEFMVHTKISGGTDLSLKHVLQSIEESMQNLKVSRIEVLYFHSPELLLSGRTSQSAQIIKSIRESGMVNKIGASVYLEKEVEIISNDWPEIEVYQVPENILDQRLLNSEIITRLSNSGILFYVRSIFLQGLLLMEQEQVSSHFPEAVDYLRNYKNYLLANNLSSLEATLSYLNLLTWASGFLIGVDSAAQLREVLRNRENLLTEDTLPTPLPHPWVDPRNW